ncbi:MAG: barstar family protein [Fimbriimonadales bacterium]
MTYESFVKILISAPPPWLHLVICQYQTITEWFAYQFRDQETFPQFVIRTLQGRRCSTKQPCLREFAKVLEFPPYFGYNRDALDECLADLADWLPANGYVLVFLNSDQLLADSEEDFRILIEVLQTAANEWASRQPPVPFHAIFQCLPSAKDRMLARLRTTGMSFSFWDCADERT